MIKAIKEVFFFSIQERGGDVGNGFVENFLQIHFPESLVGVAPLGGFGLPRVYLLKIPLVF